MNDLFQFKYLWWTEPERYNTGCQQLGVELDHSAYDIMWLGKKKKGQNGHLMVNQTAFCYVTIMPS